MAEKTTTEKEPVIVVGPGADEDDQVGAPVETGEPAAGEDYRYAGGDDDDEGRDAGEERAGHAQNEPGDDDGAGLSREQKRRKRKREKYDRDQRELGFLRNRNEQLEREHSTRLASMENRQTQSDVLAIDGRISQAENDVREAESLLTQALEAKDSAAAVEALRVRDQLRDGLNQLKGAKHHTVRAAQERQTAATQQPVTQDTQVSQRAREWAREHSWFDPNEGNDDSAIAKAVERRLYNEGRLHPASDEYWDEVDRRLAKRLPEHYGTRVRDDDDDTPPARRVNGNGRDKDSPRRASGPTIKVGGRERTLKKGEVYIDEDRKAALVEAGVWDDPEQREKFLKSYLKYDREAGRRPR